MLFKFFSHLQNFLKIGIDTHPIDLSCHQKFEKNSPTGSENISTRSWKIWKSHGRLDPTLRMRKVVHARSIKFLRVQNDRLPSGRILCDKDIFFPYDGFTGYKKSKQNQFGRALPFAFALTCYKIYLLYSSFSDFDSFRWRVHLSDGVCRLRARVQLKTLSSLLKICSVWMCTRARSFPTQRAQVTSNSKFYFWFERYITRTVYSCFLSTDEEAAPLSPQSL